MINFEIQPSRYDFSVVAEGYDSWYATREGSLYDQCEKAAVLKHLPARQNHETLLDVGCGTGHWSEFFSKCGYAVTGVDISEKMIDIAKSKNNDNITYSIGDAHRLPFPDAIFDITAAITTLEFTRNPAGVIQEMVRCTKKPGGAMLIGALNSRAAINRKRQNRDEPLYADAFFLSPRQLHNMLVPYGMPKIIPTAFVPQSPAMYPLVKLYNALGTFLRLPTGAFILGEVRL